MRVPYAWLAGCFWACRSFWHRSRATPAVKLGVTVRNSNSTRAGAKLVTVLVAVLVAEAEIADFNTPKKNLFLVLVFAGVGASFGAIVLGE